MMSKQYYLCTTFDATPKEVVEETVAEINHMLKSEGINAHITQYEPDDTGGYDYKTEFLVSKLTTEPAIPKTREEHFDECLRKWSGTKKQKPSLPSS